MTVQVTLRVWQTMIGTSTLKYVFIRICITGLRAITPLSILYCVACPLPASPAPSHRQCLAHRRDSFLLFSLPLPAIDSPAFGRPSTSTSSSRTERTLRLVCQAYSGPKAILGEIVQACPLVRDQKRECKRILQMGVLEHRSLRSNG